MRGNGWSFYNLLSCFRAPCLVRCKGAQESLRRLISLVLFVGGEEPGLRKSETMRRDQVCEAKKSQKKQEE